MLYDCAEDCEPDPNARYVDMGTYWHDTQCRTMPVYDKVTGEYIGAYYTPYIPKCIVPNDPNKW
jgi:hypothetical protein